ncbi:hypothetical protein [Adhaeribacter radiodurans]|uniref:Uncharacterized protein n=1 Tax=Adhaeribacter radiodurans TaxID=2745197 RepID=A0A7L7L7G0_9BACT|nr:hypothetical protein [Adhaeribacter radiodurans]QMU28771.1 hypothetical protein HUW48_12320 [Adhaeribacter radiodurans]
MKKLQIQISDAAHSELLKIQLERKVNKEPRTTIVEIASDVLENTLVKDKKDISAK